MAGPSRQIRPHALHIFSTKSPSPPTLSTTMKLKTLIHTLIISHVCRVARAISRARSILVQLLKEQHHTVHHFPKGCSSSKNKYYKKVLFGSFRLHYNWCSSHVPATIEVGHLCRDAAWNSFVSKRSEAVASNVIGESSRALSGYLQWLEEKADEADTNEIDKLADVFIANCHEKFRLEKQESYRRFQEMLARSM